MQIKNNVLKRLKISLCISARGCPDMNRHQVTRPSDCPGDSGRDSGRDSARDSSRDLSRDLSRDSSLNKNKIKRPNISA